MTDRSGEQTPLAPATKFSYDDLGLVKAIQGGEQTLQEYAYDDRGRLVGLKNPLGYTVSFTYDDADRMTAVSTAAGKVTYVYDALGRLVEVTDQLNRRSATNTTILGTFLVLTTLPGV